MDNDNKIMKLSEQQRHKEVLMFLQNELDSLKQKDEAETYNLEKEYSKTKDNKSPFIWLLMLGCLVVVALVTFGLSKTIEKANREIKVNLEEFDDVNLKGLLDTVARTQEQYEAAVKVKAQLELEKKAELAEASRKRNNELLVIKSMVFDNKEDEDKRKKEANDAYAQQVIEINKKYDPQIASITGEVEEFKKKLDEYDKSKLTVAQEQQNALDAQRQLQEIERKRIIDEYEARIANLELVLQSVRDSSDQDMESSLFAVSDKFQSELAKYQDEVNLLDPVVFDAKADKIVSDSMQNEKSEEQFKNHYVYSDDGIKDGNLDGELKRVKSLYEDYKYMSKILTDVPYKHSLKDYTQATDKIVDDISVSFADLMQSMYEDNVSLEQQIEDLKKEAESLIEMYKQEIVNLGGTVESNETFGRTVSSVQTNESTETGDSESDESGTEKIEQMETQDSTEQSGTQNSNEPREAQAKTTPSETQTKIESSESKSKTEPSENKIETPAATSTPTQSSESAKELENKNNENPSSESEEQSKEEAADDTNKKSFDELYESLGSEFADEDFYGMSFEEFYESLNNDFYDDDDEEENTDNSSVAQSANDSSNDDSDEESEEDLFIEILNKVNADALVKSLEKNGDVILFVHPALRNKVSSVGVDAEIEAQQSIYGRIYPTAGEDFLFVPYTGKDDDEEEEDEIVLTQAIVNLPVNFLR